MSTLSPERQAELRTLITTFLDERQTSKLDKLLPDDPKHAELREQFDPPTWLADAARRVGQLQAVTHSLKAIHPDAKGSNLYVEPAALPKLPVVGSHCLGEQFDADVVGNAAALDVYKFLKLQHGGRSLLALCEAADADLAAALDKDQAAAQAWMASFASLTTPRGKPASHTLAKQLYWMVGGDPHEDASFELLAPLYPTSLVHRVHATIQGHRFGDAAKAARAARKAKAFSDQPVHDYADLAVQQLGGTKPQNISQLNSERRGNNLLLASLPPSWQSADVQPVLGVESMFERYGRRRPVRALWAALRKFLEDDKSTNLAAREHRAEQVDGLIDELLFFTAEIRRLAPGWSAQSACHLSATHKRWLDPDGPWPDLPGPAIDDDIKTAMAEGFANWLNARLRNPLAMEDPEFLAWRKAALTALMDDDWGLNHGQ